MPREITKLYFVDLSGAAAATLILDPLLQVFGAESLLLLISILVIGSSIISRLVLNQHTVKNGTADYLPGDIIEKKLIAYGIVLTQYCQ